VLAPKMAVVVCAYNILGEMSETDFASDYILSALNELGF